MNTLDTLERVGNLASTYFVVWILVFAGAALVTPDSFTWIVPYITPLLGVIMLGMGLTLRPVDFERIVERPRDVAIGAIAQWVVMPVAAWALTVALSLPPALAIGVVLLGAAPGGTASNVMTYLADGDVALSVSITTVTTLAAPIVMPAWVVALAGEQLSVTFVEMFSSIVQVVLIPVIAGFVLRLLLDRYAPRGRRGRSERFPGGERGRHRRHRGRGGRRERSKYPHRRNRRLRRGDRPQRDRSRGGLRRRARGRDVGGTCSGVYLRGRPPELRARGGARDRVLQPDRRAPARAVQRLAQHHGSRARDLLLAPVARRTGEDGTHERRLKGGFLPSHGEVRI